VSGPGIRCLIAFALAIAAAGASGAAPPGDELKALRAKLEALKRDIAKGEDSRNEAADQLKASEQAISEASRRLAELAAERRDADQRLTEIGTRIRALESHLADQQGLAARLIHKQYTAKPSGPFALIASGQDPNEIARTLVYLGYVAQARRGLLDGLKSDRDALQALHEEAAKRRQEIAAIHAGQTAETKRLEAERLNRKTMLAKISSQLDRQRREVGTLQRDERRLARLVEELTRMLAARKPPAPARVPQPARERPSDAQPQAEGTAFQQLKGRLLAPIKGELVGRFGSPRSDSGLSWRGLFIQAPAGRDVKAVAAGRVVFADWLRGFGNLLILDHGDGFMSLYGNNETLLGRLGDPVRAGDTVATTGSSGGNTSTGLYFELRHQGKPFDPAGWINLK